MILYTFQGRQDHLCTNGETPHNESVYKDLAENA